GIRDFHVTGVQTGAHPISIGKYPMTTTPAYKAALSFSDNAPSIEFPVYKGTTGPDVIDIRKLYAQTGRFTFDPGFMSTAACESRSAERRVGQAWRAQRRAT